MTIATTLLEYALKNVWSNPHADRNAVFKTTKLTSNSGGVGTVSFPFGNFILPPTGKRYMLLELGLVPSMEIGLVTPLYDWTLLSDIIQDYGTLVLVFSRGRFISIKGSYLTFLENGNCLLAIDYATNLKLMSLKDDFYVRFYTNLFYDGNVPAPDQSLKVGHFTRTGGSEGTYLTFTAAVNALPGPSNVPAMILKNGLYLPDGLPAYSSLVDGDFIEFMYDPLLVDIHSLPIATLPGYFSTVDSSNKVIASLDIVNDNIFVDDTEFLISGVKPNGERVGVYFPRLDPSVIRLLTFKDWGVKAGMMNSRISELEAFSDVNAILTETRLHVLRRNNKEYRPDVMDGNFIPDIMNLPVEFRDQALTGVNATIPAWRAPVLETCAFNRWISATIEQLPTTPLQNVFSRYSALQVLERVRQSSETSEWYLPRNAGAVGGTLVHYGANGEGVTFTAYTAGDDPTAPYADGQGYELYFPGPNSTENLDLHVLAGDTTPTVVPAGYGILCYYLVDGVPTYADNYSDYNLSETEAGTVITWSEAMHAEDRYVRSAQSAIIFSRSTTQAEFNTGVDLYNGRPKAFDVGMGNLMVWYNDRFMVEGLDYQVHDGLLYLTSKPANWSDPAVLKVIYAGLPKKSLHHEAAGLWGWVEHGSILNDGKYDLIMHRGKLFFVNGRAVTLQEITEKEEYQDSPDNATAVPFVEGQPFAIVDPVQFSREEDLDQLAPTHLAESILTSQISAYLSLIDPQPQNLATVIIPEKYRLVSPLLNQLIEDIEANAYIVTIDGNSTTAERDAALTEILTLYQDYLRIDPSLKGFNSDYVTITPRWSDTPVDMTIAQFNFLILVNNLLLNGQVQGINLFVNITS